MILNIQMMNKELIEKEIERHKTESEELRLIWKKYIEMCEKRSIKSDKNGKTKNNKTRNR